MKYKAKKVRLKHQIKNKNIDKILRMLQKKIKVATKVWQGIDADKFINEIRGR